LFSAESPSSARKGYFLWVNSLVETPRVTRKKGQKKRTLKENPTTAAVAAAAGDEEGQEGQEGQGKREKKKKKKKFFFFTYRLRLAS